MSLSPSITCSTETEEDALQIALPDFDDPNIDKEAAIQGVLGTYDHSFNFSHSPFNRGRLSLP
jgi:hypothetical protein